MPFHARKVGVTCRCVEMYMSLWQMCEDVHEPVAGALVTLFRQQDAALLSAQQCLLLSLMHAISRFSLFAPISDWQPHETHQHQRKWQQHSSGTRQRAVPRQILSNQQCLLHSLSLSCCCSCLV